MSSHLVRPYRPRDRATVRALCADTGFLGQPIDPVFEDRELFADYLTSYYTDAEPESTFICEIDGEVKGYLMGSRFPRKKSRYELVHLPGLVARGLWRCFTRPYQKASRNYILWILTKARKQVPFTPPGMPHLHINIRPEARSIAATRELVDTYLNYLVAQGETGVYGQIVAFSSRRGDRLFARFGFKLVDQRELTKYRDFYPEKVFLYTVVKDLTQNVPLYGFDLAKKKSPIAPGINSE